jgi:hypothetical protein
MIYLFSRRKRTAKSGSLFLRLVLGWRRQRVCYCDPLKASFFKKKEEERKGRFHRGYASAISLDASIFYGKERGAKKRGFR